MKMTLWNWKISQCYQFKSFMYGVHMKLYRNPIITNENLRLEGGGRDLLYRYPTKVYNLTRLSDQVFHVRGTCEISLKSERNLKIADIREGGGSIVLGVGRSILHFQFSFDHEIINFHGFQGYSSNTYTRIHNHIIFLDKQRISKGGRALKSEPGKIWKFGQATSRYSQEEAV